MRQDIYHVIHEAGRSRGSHGVKRRLQLVDGESLEPVRQSMRRVHLQGYGKESLLNLSPLRRFIASKVGQPWSKVYAELRQALRQRDPAMTDPMDYLRVEPNTSMLDGEVVCHSRWGGFHLAEAYCDYYVHPQTGLLCRSTNRAGRAKYNREREASYQAEREARMRVLSDTVQLHCVDGQWYEVTLGTLPSAAAYTRYYAMTYLEQYTCRATIERFDVVRHKQVWSSDFHDLAALYGRKGVYALSKRQLNRRELKMHGLSAKTH